MEKRIKLGKAIIGFNGNKFSDSVEIDWKLYPGKLPLGISRVHFRYKIISWTT